MTPTRDRRTYDQECGLAYALDVVGERWTLLIIRELLLRPRRYNELLDALPGIGTNLLADRLAFLTTTGLIEPLDPGRRTAGYALTELGRSLHEPILGLARFGLTVGSSQPHHGDEAVRPAWAALAIEAMIDSSRAPDVDEVYQFDVDGEVFHVVVEGGRASTRPGPAEDPTLVTTTDSRTFFDLGMRRLDPIEALVGGAVQVTGLPAAVPRFLRLIGLGPQQAVTPPAAPTSVKPPAARARPASRAKAAGAVKTAARR